MKDNRSEFEIRIEVGILKLGVKRKRKQTLEGLNKELGFYTTGSNLNTAIIKRQMDLDKLKKICLLIGENYEEMLILKYKDESSK